MKFLKMLCLILSLSIILNSNNIFANTQTDNKRELRATWVSTVINLDWPPKESTKIENDKLRIDTQKAELIKILDEAVSLNLNAIIFQVRPTADAFYNSTIEPWSYFLTGKMNINPGYDPLEFAVTEAHNRGLEFHAWFNPYRVSMPASSYGLKTMDEVKTLLSKEPKNVYAKYPDWVKIAQDRLVLDPGIPAAREYIEKSVMEVVNNYDIDAVHFDDYFYVGVTGGKDGIDDKSTFAKYNNGFKTIEDWRRNNTQVLVENISTQIKLAKPWVKFGISPAGVWRNSNVDKLGSNTKAGLPNYDSAYADTRKWVMDNTIDYIMPQVYWSFGLEAAPYGVISDWWSDLLKNNPSIKTQLYIGVGLYRIESPGSDPLWNTADNSAYKELNRQLTYNIDNPYISGTGLFRHKNINSDLAKPFIEDLKTNIWNTKALVPTMDKLGGKAPIAPILISASKDSKGNTLVWSDMETSTSELNKTKYYAIYRIPSTEKLDINKSKYIIAIVADKGEGNISFTDTSMSKNVSYTITALNRLYDESLPSNKISVN